MSYAYTPGLKIKKHTQVTVKRQLPIAGEVLVSDGEEVHWNRIVARTHILGDVDMIPLFHFLGCEPYELSKVMLKKEGDDVQEGELLASISSFFGLVNSSYHVEHSGTIELCSEVTGMVGIRRSPVPINVNAYISGKVTKILPGQGVDITTPATYIQGIFGVGGERQGQIHIVADRDEIITPGHIDKDCIGKIIVGGSLATFDVLKKAEEEGIAGIVTGGIKRMDLNKFLEYDIGVAITGHEEIGSTFIITEGIGRMPMAKHTYDLLISCEGKNASINGATQIRAGVIRPEIIIPTSDIEFKETDEEESVLAEGMYSGTRVRIIRQPYFGAIGTVDELPVELQQLESESWVRVMSIKLDDGRVVTIPRANAEILEE